MGKIFWSLCGGVWLTFIFAGCSGPTYKPEVSGKGVTVDRNSLVYSIPPTQPVLKMRLSYRGINDENLIHIHLRFLRRLPYNPSNPGVLDPTFQTIQIEGQGPIITPTRVHAATKHRPLIELSPEPRQAIDLQFKIPSLHGQTPRFEFFNFHWKIQLSNGQFEEQIVRFDRQHSHMVSSAPNYEDPDFAPYDDFEDMGWYPGGWDWW